MKKILLFTCFLFIFISFLGCNKKDEESDSMNNVLMVIDDKEYEVILYDNKTASDFYNLLPLNIKMSELNGNEFYYYMNDKLTTNTKKVDNINTGDIKLYGDNCIVLFYDNFKTSYSYTDIGYVKDKSFIREINGRDIDIIFKVKD